ncbi:MAG: hypothetical protein P0S94_04020 [Simkaniaceae bacterium]|nr:hypothetical protein [Simkaniaceae bacterium]
MITPYATIATPLPTTTDDPWLPEPEIKAGRVKTPYKEPSSPPTHKYQTIAPATALVIASDHLKKAPLTFYYCSEIKGNPKLPSMWSFSIGEKIISIYGQTDFLTLFEETIKASNRSLKQLSTSQTSITFKEETVHDRIAPLIADAINTPLTGSEVPVKA